MSNNNVASQLHSGLIGSHIVITITLDRILSIGGGPNPGAEQDRTPAGMRIYMLALLHFVESHHKHEDHIFFPFFTQVRFVSFAPGRRRGGEVRSKGSNRGE